MKHLFILNPVAGKINQTEALSKRIREAMARREEKYEIYVTAGPMDACGVIRERAAGGEKLRVYACGGDGTLNECVNGAAGLDNVALTHYPIGTGNDFIKIFGSGAAKFKDIEALLGECEEKKIDLIDCNGRYSVNICSVGVDARIGTDVHRYSALPFVSGHGAYWVSSFANLLKGINRRFVVRIDGEETEGDFALICASNGRFYGGGFNTVPEASPDDGQLDFLIINKVSRLDFIRLIGKFKAGRYKELPEKYIRYRRGSDICIEARENIRINVDGELMEGYAAEFAVVPGKLNFFFPKGISW